MIVLWTANTERYSEVAEGLNDTTEAFLSSIDSDESEVAPSSIYAAASILEGVPFINGSPQNTFVPGLIDLAVEKGELTDYLHHRLLKRDRRRASQGASKGALRWSAQQQTGTEAEQRHVEPMRIMRQTEADSGVCARATARHGLGKACESGF